MTGSVQRTPVLFRSLSLQSLQRTIDTNSIGLAATTKGSHMYEKPKVRDYGDLTALTAAVVNQAGEEIGVKSNNVKVA